MVDGISMVLDDEGWVKDGVLDGTTEPQAGQIPPTGLCEIGELHCGQVRIVQIISIIA